MKIKRIVKVDIHEPMGKIGGISIRAITDDERSIEIIYRINKRVKKKNSYNSFQDYIYIEYRKEDDDSIEWMVSSLKDDLEPEKDFISIGMKTKSDREAMEKLHISINDYYEAAKEAYFSDECQNILKEKDFDFTYHFTY